MRYSSVMGRAIEPDVFNSQCPAQQALDLVADKWTLLVLLALLGGAKRHGALRRKIGVTQKMLTQTLRRLEHDGLVRRAESPARPLKVEYSLTPLGMTLREPILALSAWAETHSWELEEARKRAKA